MGGKPAARRDDMTLKGGPITQGSLTVYIGSQGGVACSTCPGGVKKGNPVNPMLGAKVQVGEIDVALPGALPFVISRDYSSYQTDTPAPVGLLGPGWWLPDEVSVLQSESGLTINDSKGRSIRFDPLAPGQADYSRSENLWIVRGGRERLDETPGTAEARLNMAWLALHERDRLNPNLFFVANSPMGPWWIVGAPSSHPDITGHRLPLLGLNDRFGHALRIMRKADGVTVQDGSGRQYRLEIKITAQFANAGIGGWGSDTGARLMAVHLTHDPHCSDLPGHPLVRYEYTPRGELSAVYGRDGSRLRQFQYHFQLLGRMTAHAHAGRPAVQYVYNAEGKVTEQHRQGALSYRFEYAEDNTTVTDSMARTMVYHFEGEAGLRRVVKVQHPDGSITQSRYDASGRLTTLIDALGRETHYQLDIATGNVTTVIVPGGQQVHSEYNVHGRIVKSVGAGGAQTRYEYDEWGRIAVVTDALGYSTRYYYGNEQEEQPSMIEDARGGKKHLTWNAVGQLLTYTDCSGSVTRYCYDRWGSLIETRGEEGSHSTSTLDERGRLIRSTNALGQSTTYAYDEAGDLISVTGADGNSVRFERDVQGRPTVYHYGGYTQQFAYDEAGRLTLLTNENGAHTTFEYDVMDRLTQQVNFDGRTQRYHYDAAGQLSESDDEGIFSRHTYDDAGRLILRITGEGEAAPQEHFQYGKDGGLDKAWHRTGVGGNLITNEFTRDIFGRITEDTQIITGVDGIEVWRYSTKRAFDELGNESQTTYDGLPTIEWQTYGSGHLHGVVLDGKTLIDFERDKLHREISRTFGETKTTRTYDALSRLSKLHTHSPHIGEDYALNRQHHYDLAGQLTRINTGQGVHEYGYDKAGRLIAASQPGLQNQRYRFDPAGNRLFENTRPLNTQADWEETVRQNIKDRNFNLLGEQTAQSTNDTQPKWMDNRITDDGKYRYEYDRWGNTTKKYKVDGNEIHHFHYDRNHRLIQHGFESDEAVRGANYHYDVFGRRLCKQLQHADRGGNISAPLESTFFGWDGNRLVLTEKDSRQIHSVYQPTDFVPMIRLEGVESPHQDIKMKIQKKDIIRVWGGDMFINANKNDHLLYDLQSLPEGLINGLDSCVRRELGLEKNNAKLEGKQIHFYQCDHLGCPLSLIGNKDSVDWSVSLDAWGVVVGIANPMGIYQPIRLPGQQEDEVNKFFYNRYRHYDPRIGRYISQDPVGIYGGINFFAYPVNPVLLTDPLGLWASKSGAYVHQRVGFLVFGKEITQTQLSAVARGHVWADSAEHQTPDFTHMHAMRRPGQSRSEACRETNAYITSEARKALAAKASGNMDQAFFHFGASLHAIQDATSPSHSGFQVWSGHESANELFNHGRRELFVPDEESPMFQVTRKAWESFKNGDLNGFSCPCD